MNSNTNSITEQSIADSYKIASGPYTAEQMWTIVYSDFNGDLNAVHTHLNKALPRVQALREAGYEAKRDNLTNTANDLYDQADDLEARIMQVRRYLRAVAAAAILAESNRVIISPDNLDYRNQSPVYAQVAR